MEGVAERSSLASETFETFDTRSHENTLVARVTRWTVWMIHRAPEELSARLEQLREDGLDALYRLHAR